MFLVEASETQASLAAAAQLGVIFLSRSDCSVRECSSCPEAIVLSGSVLPVLK